MSPRVQRTVIDPEVVGVWQDTHPLNAPQGLFAGVRPLMDSDAALPGEAFGVDRALEALFADVRPFVAGDISLSGEPPGAERTPEGLVAGVRPIMGGDVRWVFERAPGRNPTPRRRAGAAHPFRRAPAAPAGAEGARKEAGIRE